MAFTLNLQQFIRTLPRTFPASPRRKAASVLALGRNVGIAASLQHRRLLKGQPGSIFAVVLSALPLLLVSTDPLGNLWVAAAISAVLLYLIWEWDGRILVGFGIICIVAGLTLAGRNNSQISTPFFTTAVVFFAGAIVNSLVVRMRLGRQAYPLEGTLVAGGSSLVIPAVLQSYLRRFSSTKLYTNSTYLIMDQAVTALLGFLFWIVVSRYYPANQVGLATALVSSVMLLGSIATLGFNFSFLRFLPEKKYSSDRIISTGLTITGAVSLSVAGIYVIGLSLWSPALQFVQGSITLTLTVLVGTLAWTLFALLDSVFIGFGRANYVILKNGLFQVCKLVAPIGLAVAGGFGVQGIFSSWALPLMVVLLISAFLFVPQVHPGLRPRLQLRFNGRPPSEILAFSLVNYGSSLSRLVPGFIFTIMIVNLVSAEMGAYFFVAWTIGIFLGTVSYMVSNVLLAETAANVKSLARNTRRSLSYAVLVLIPPMLILALVGDKVLLLFGSQYSVHGTGVIHLLAISAVPAVVNHTYLAILRVERRSHGIILLPLFLSVGSIVLGYFLLQEYGILGAAIAWLAVQSAGALMVAPKVMKVALDQEAEPKKLEHRIAIVTAYPPSRGPLSEYGWHLVQHLKQNPRSKNILVLADRVPGAPDYEEQGDNICIMRCWTYNSVFFPLKLLAALRGRKIDVLWFNMHLTSTGHSRLSRFIGVASPLIFRLAGHQTLVTLHNMLGLTDMGRVGMKYNCLDVIGAKIATWLASRASAISVLLKEYADILRTHYHTSHVYVIPHGALGVVSDAPTPNNNRIILTLGHFGTYKRLEPVLEAMEELSHDERPIQLYVAGEGSHHTDDYMSRVKQEYAHVPNVRYLGYVPENELPGLFRQSTAVVLPYGTITGASGVMILAAMHGKPILASDIPGFRIMERDGLEINFFKWENRESLVQQIRSIVSSLDLQREQGLQNLDYCRRQSMDIVVEQYLQVIDQLAGAQTSPTSSEIKHARSEPAIES